MEPTSNTLCHTCLGQLELPINLFESNYRDLLDVLQRLLGFQVFIQGKEFNVCYDCQRKLIWISEFQTNCLKSLEPLRRDSKPYFAAAVEEVQVIPKDDDDDEDVAIKTERSISPDFDQSQSEDDDYCLASLLSKVDVRLKRSPSIEKWLPKKRMRSTRRRRKIRKVDTEVAVKEDDSPLDAYISADLDNKKEGGRFRRSRNKQFPFKDVLRAIKKFNSSTTDMKYKHCILCDFDCKNATMLRNHMTNKHKDADNWCKNCNVQVEDLQKHRDAVRCHMQHCEFCQKSFIFEKPYNFRDHLKTHCGKFIGEIGKTFSRKAKAKLKQFPMNEVLRAIQDTLRTDLPIGGKSSLKKGCKFCEETFNRKSSLRRHLRYHCQELLFQNFELTPKESNQHKQYPDDEVLRAITDCRAYLTDTNRMKCVHCEYTSPTVRHLSLHMRSMHTSQLEGWCKRCNIQSEDLQFHVTTAKCLENRCVFCGTSFYRNDKLVSHLKLHCVITSKHVGKSKTDITNGDTTYDTDGDTDDDGNIETSNSETSKKKTERYCAICDKSFRNIKLHMTKKHNFSNDSSQNKEAKKSFKSTETHLCPVCGKIFKTEAGVNNHVLTHYGDPQFKCPTCGKCFFNKNVLKIHEMVHSEIKAYVCHICGKGSTQKRDHKKHLEIHEGGPVKCTICEKEFPRPGVLKLHMRHHTGENQFRCIPCGKSFHIKSLLSQHMEMHKNDDDRSYKCPVCGKGYKAKENLRRHKLIHTGEKRYKCSICTFRCVQAAHLTTHMKQHPEDAPQASKPHNCPLCHKSFSTNALLMSHTDISHRNNSKQFVNNAFNKI